MIILHICEENTYYFVLLKEADLTEVALKLRENEDPCDTNRSRSIASGN